MKWWGKSWNPMTGCTPCSPACEHCYAERMARRFRKDVDEAYFTPTFHPERLDQPLHWKKPQRVFVCSMSDLFHEAFDTSQLMRVFVTMSRANWHTYMILTKRPERMRDIFSYVEDDPAPHLMLGVSVWDQESADRNIPILLDTPAAKRFVSYEPALGPVDLRPYLCSHDCEDFGLCGLDGTRGSDCAYPRLSWVICGGETGPGARPMDPAWALSVYEQCKDAGVPFWFKGWGSYVEQRLAPDAPLEMEQTHEFPDTP